MVKLYRATILQWASWHRGDSPKHFSGGLHNLIKHTFIDSYRPSGMSHLHRNMKCLDRWHSACTASTDSKSRKTWSAWTQLTCEVNHRLGYLCFGCVFVALEPSLGRNDTSIMSYTLSNWASYTFKNLILVWIPDHSCARPSIIGQQILGSESCSLAMNTRAMSHYPTLWDADVEECPNFNNKPSKAATLLRISERMSDFWTEALNIALTDCIAKWDGHIYCAECVITLCPGFTGALELRS